MPQMSRLSFLHLELAKSFSEKEKHLPTYFQIMIFCNVRCNVRKQNVALLIAWQCVLLLFVCLFFPIAEYGLIYCQVLGKIWQDHKSMYLFILPKKITFTFFTTLLLQILASGTCFLTAVVFLTTGLTSMTSWQYYKKKTHLTDTKL